MLFFQILFLIFFAAFGKYDVKDVPGRQKMVASESAVVKYPIFEDIHTIIFVGFGFLVTFLKRYGFSAISTNILLASFTMQWALIIRGIVFNDWNMSFTTSIESIIGADLTVAVILITMGVVVGKLSPAQYIVMAAIETPISIMIEYIVKSVFKINDLGGSMVVHAFGAYFGMGLSKAISKKRQREHDNDGSAYHTDMFSMIGTVFLWVYWPSFNAAFTVTTDARHRAIVNTVLALAASTVTTFLASQLFDKERRFTMKHIANATLSGGVAVAATAGVILEPFHALLIGVVAAFVSVAGFKFITPKLAQKVGIHDTRGVHNVHGLPAIVGAIFSIIFVLAYDEKIYGQDLYTFYPGMMKNTRTGEEGFTTTTQALYQLISLAIIIVGSIVTGFITGMLLKIKVWDQVLEAENFADGDYYHVPPDFDFTSKIVSTINKVELNEYHPLMHKEV